MTWRCHDLNTETPHIPCKSSKNIEVKFTCGTSAGRDLTDLQGFGTEFQKFPVSRSFRFINFSRMDNKPFSCHVCQTVFLGKTDCFPGAYFGTIPAKDTFSCVDRTFSSGECNCICGTCFAAFSAVYALFTEDHRASIESVRQYRGLIRKFSGSVSLKKSGTQSFQHNITSQIMSAVGQIETFVANREVGNLFFPECHRQSGPVMEGGIRDFISAERMIFSCNSYMA